MQVHAADRLQVIGTQLCSSSGTPVRLQGVSTHGIAWYPKYINKKSFKRLRDDWHVNTIRLAMYTKEYGGYLNGGSKKKLEKLIDKGVKATDSLGMYCIIDWHILSDGNPLSHVSQARTFFGKMSARYASRGNVIYEICNEPNGGTSWDSIKQYADQVIPVIRSHDPDGIILVGTPTWSQDVDQVAAAPVAMGHNVMYTCHFYAGTHGQSYRDKVIRALRAGTPVFISEFAICSASGRGKNNTKEAAKWWQLIRDNNLSCVGWSLSNKKETCSLIKHSCRKTSGWKKSQLTAWGKWLRAKYRKG